MTFAAYAQIQAVNFSSLKALARSAAHYRHGLLHPRGDKDCFRMGRAVHMSVLQPEVFGAEFAVWPNENGRRFGKKWDAFAEEFGENILKEDEHRECMAIADSVRSNPTAIKYLTGGVAENTTLWTDAETKIPCKCRTDYAAPKWIVDLKTTRDASPITFGRECYRYSYHAQAAFYADGVAEANGGVVRQFVIVAVEKDPPHVCQTYHVPEVTMEAGREQVREWMRTLAQCRATDTWPAYAPAEVELLLPDWAVGGSDPENDLSELGLEAIG